MKLSQVSDQTPRLALLAAERGRGGRSVEQRSLNIACVVTHRTSEHRQNVPACVCQTP